MIQADLAAARAAWIEEAKPEERLERERSSRLKYKDERGRFFDFHALRGQFVSNLARAGVHPKLAQQLEAAYQKVQDIAEKTVEGTSQSKSLADLQKLLIEQSRKGTGDKG